MQSRDIGQAHPLVKPTVLAYGVDTWDLTPLHATCRVERELKKWEPEGPLANLSLDMAVGKGGKGGHWDQFEVNKRMFKVRGAS